MFGVWFVAALSIAYRAVRRRDVRHHRRWMIRAYAVALGVGSIRLWIGLLTEVGNLEPRDACGGRSGLRSPCMRSQPNFGCAGVQCPTRGSGARSTGRRTFIERRFSTHTVTPLSHDAPLPCRGAAWRAKSPKAGLERGPLISGDRIKSSAIPRWDDRSRRGRRAAVLDPHTSHRASRPQVRDDMTHELVGLHRPSITTSSLALEARQAVQRRYTTPVRRSTVGGPARRGSCVARRWARARRPGGRRRLPAPRPAQSAQHVCARGMKGVVVPHVERVQ